MKHLFGLILVVVFIASCKQGGGQEASTTAENTSTSTEAPVEATVNGDLNDFTGTVGKKLKADNLMEKGNLTERLKKLLGSEYNDFAADWSEETALKQDAELLYAVGCKQGDCASNKYFLVLDLGENTINIHNFKGTKIKTYEEGPIIGFTINITDDYQKVRKDQGL